MLNRVMLIGRLGADPETRYTAGGDAVTSVRLATSDHYRDRSSGEAKEVTEWHRVVFFGRLAEIVREYQRKGSLIVVEGRLRTRKWQGSAGQDRYTTEVVAASLRMLGNARAGDESATDERATDERATDVGARDAGAYDAAQSGAADEQQTFEGPIGPQGAAEEFGVMPDDVAF